MTNAHPDPDRVPTAGLTNESASELEREMFGVLLSAARHGQGQSKIDGAVGVLEHLRWRMDQR